MFLTAALSVALLLSTATATTLLQWNAQTGMKGWKEKENVHCQNLGDRLVLTDIRRDPQVASPILNLNPHQVNHISFRYRALNTPPGSGQVFFAHQPGKFVPRKYWHIPALKADGNWHQMILTPENLPYPDLWFKRGNIVQLRLDPTDLPGGTIELADIRLYYQKVIPPPRPRPLPNVTFKLDEPPWPKVRTEFIEKRTKPVAQPYFRGQLIYSPLDRRGNTPNTSFYLRRSFTLAKKPVQAWIQYIADDAAVASVNGTVVAQASNWRVAEVVEVSSELKKGNNCLGFKYSNTYSAGGVMAELFMLFSDGSVRYINTDKGFKTTVKATDGWDTPTFDDSAWSEVLVAGGPPSPPWTQRIYYRDFAHAHHFKKSTVIPRQVTAGQRIRLTFEFQGIHPPLPIHAVILMKNGDSLLWDETLDLGRETVTETAKDSWRIAFDYQLPACLRSNQVTLKLESNAIFCKTGGEPQVEFQLKRLQNLPGWDKPVTAQVKQTDFGPTMFVNHTPFYPLWGGVNQRAREDLLPRHGSGPLNLVTVYCSSSLYWPRTGVFDPSVLDYQAEKYLRQNPDAWFMWDLSLYPPRDWAEKHPDQLCLDDHGEVNRDGGYPNYSFASPAAKKAIMDMIPVLINYLEHSPYANKIVGYRINSGHTIEWLGWDPMPGRILDFSPIARKAFQNYAQKHYPQLKHADIPSLAERQQLDQEEIIWDPQRHLRTIAYHNFYSDIIADMLIDACRLARKQVSNQKLIGTYYGYVATLNAGGNAQMRAHYALKKVLDADTVDFLMSPQNYSIRRLGNTNGDMKPFASIENHGILSVIEDDSRTHNSRYLTFSNNYQTLNEFQTIGTLRRNAGISLCRNQPIYFYALCAGTELDFPAAGHDMASMLAMGQFALEQKARRNAEIAMVFSERTITSMPMLRKHAPTGLIQHYDRQGTPHTVRTGECVQATASFNTNLTTIARTGAPVDYLLAEDLHDHTRTYKLYVFVNCFRYDDHFLKAVDNLRRKKVTLLWLYAPGYGKDNQISIQNMQKLTGFQFAKASQTLMPAVKLTDGHWMGTRTTRIAPMFHVHPAPNTETWGVYEDGTIGCAAMNTGEARSVFVGTYQLDLTFLTQLTRRAGVHLYSETADPVEANSMLVALHARFPGRKTIRFRQLGDVVDVFNRRMVARNTSTYSFDAPLHSSWLFYCGPDAEKLLRKLKVARP